MGAPAYYNEHDKYAAEWLRNLINAGRDVPGVVDDRSIEDVTPSDLEGFGQCHFFAGVGVWSLALRNAGWADNRRVWTASCPCQPFSAAGEGVGFDDERHLWPAFYWLWSEYARRRGFSDLPTVLGEQVASSFAAQWIDLVHADVEAMDHSFGCVPFPSAGVGAPHIRDRNYWVAYPDDSRLEGRPFLRQRGDKRTAGPDSLVVRLADTNHQRRIGKHALLRGDEPGRLAENCVETSRGSQAGDLPGPTNGPWRDADWLACTDGKWRPVEPGTFPLAHGATSRVGRLRAYGNAINAEAARVFIQAVMAVID